MKKPNPFLILCESCGDIVCYKCGQYTDRIASTDDQVYSDRVQKQQAKHMLDYEHTYLDYIASIR